jgi:hypothetical protein
VAKGMHKKGVSEKLKNILQNSNITELVNQNIGSTRIREKLRVNFDVEELPSKDTIVKYLKEELGRDWDSSKRRWVVKDEHKNSHTIPKINLEEGTEESGQFDGEESVVIEENLDKEFKTNENNFNTNTVKINEDISLLKDQFESMNKELIIIKELKKPVEKSIDKSAYNYLIMLNLDKKRKYSVSLNKEIVSKVEDYIKKEYKLGDNDSKCFQIAFLLLLRYIEEDPDFYRQK